MGWETLYNFVLRKLTLQAGYPGYSRLYLIMIRTIQKLTLHPEGPSIRGPYKRARLSRQSRHLHERNERVMDVQSFPSHHS